MPKFKNSAKETQLDTFWDEKVVASYEAMESKKKQKIAPYFFQGASREEWVRRYYKSVYSLLQQIATSAPDFEDKAYMIKYVKSIQEIAENDLKNAKRFHDLNFNKLLWNGRKNIDLLADNVIDVIKGKGVLLDANIDNVVFAPQP